MPNGKRRKNWFTYTEFCKAIEKHRTLDDMYRIRCNLIENEVVKGFNRHTLFRVLTSAEKYIRQTQ